MVDWTNSTVTSNEIIKALQEEGIKLTDKGKQIIIDKTYKAVVTAWNTPHNGCDCGQMSCPICS